MNELDQAHIVRFITAFQRGEAEDLEDYVVFEWADGGNLSDFWKGHPREELSAPLIQWVIGQLHGLAQALRAAHFLDNGFSFRHGDLKPANILWFRGGSGYGTLKIGDWGEAKLQEQVTALRHNTTAGSGTVRYEPPETGLQSKLPEGSRHVRSRLYDIWGFGCITLEFMIWLLYGHEELRRFNDSFGRYGNSDRFYEFCDDPGNIAEAKVHGEVTRWMDHMENRHLLCRPTETALGDLLQLVRTGLLVVSVPKGSDSGYNAGRDVPNGVEISVPSLSITPDQTESATLRKSYTESEVRIHADKLEEELANIEGSLSGDYWYQARHSKALKPPSAQTELLAVPSASSTLR